MQESPAPMVYRGLTLDKFQADAIRALEAGNSVLVCAPTGTGKTVIADWTVERALARGKEVVYTAPIKALSNQKFRDYGRLFGEEKVGLVTGDLVIRRDAPCRVMTTEILRNMLLGGETLPELDAVVIDEIHFLDDPERGTAWEELLIYLPARVQIVGLSATLRNARQFAAWLGQVRERWVEVIEEHQRAVPLQFWVADVGVGLRSPSDFAKAMQKVQKNARPARHGKGGRFGRHGPPRSPPTSHHDVFDLLVERDFLPYLYFCFSRKNVENFARSLGQRLRKSLLDKPAQAEIGARLDAFAASDAGNALEPELRALYERGVAFHHAGLNVQLKALVEELYEARLIKVLYCTSTFALGINMPARTAVFDGLRKYDGRSLRPLTTREFMQKAGRAGRRGMDEVGHVVIRTDAEEWQYNERSLHTYLRGEPEPVRSSFALSFNSIVNLLERAGRDHIREVVDRSFLAFTLQGEVKRLERDANVLAAQADRRSQKDAEKMAKRAERASGRVWDDVEARIGFLTRIGYLAGDASLNAGGRVLRHVQIEEIFVTEMVLDGLLEGLDAGRLFGLLCAVNKEFGRDVRVRLRIKGDDLDAIRAVEKIRRGEVVRESEFITRSEVCWCPEMIPFGRMWAEGKSLPELMSYLESAADISGDLVGAFRRAKDLAGQLLDVWAEEPERIAMIRKLLKDVSRDEVLVVD
ncbi:MAG: DEAD/DEAH box helicase [Deltaproteobacteria bacterium]|nr:DEAD/DEAH box helicase [Deltaproteobacteria bacterium]